MATKQTHITRGHHWEGDGERTRGHRHTAINVVTSRVIKHGLLEKCSSNSGMSQLSMFDDRRVLEFWALLIAWNSQIKERERERHSILAWNHHNLRTYRFIDQWHMLNLNGYINEYIIYILMCRVSLPEGSGKYLELAFPVAAGLHGRTVLNLPGPYEIMATWKILPRHGAPINQSF